MYVILIWYLDTNQHQCLLCYTSNGLMDVTLAKKPIIYDQPPQALMLRKERKKSILKSIEINPYWEMYTFWKNEQKLTKTERANIYQEWIKKLLPLLNVNEAEVLEISSPYTILEGPIGLQISAGAQVRERIGLPQLAEGETHHKSTDKIFFDPYAFSEPLCWPFNLSCQTEGNISRLSDIIKIQDDENVAFVGSDSAHVPISQSITAEQNNVSSEMFGYTCMPCATTIYQKNRPKRQPVNNAGRNRLQKRQRIPTRSSSHQTLSVRPVEFPADSVRQTSMLPEAALMDSTSPPSLASDGSLPCSDFGTQLSELQILQPSISGRHPVLDITFNSMKVFEQENTRDNRLEVGNAILTARIQALPEESESVECFPAQEQEQRKGHQRKPHYMHAFVFSLRNMLNCIMRWIS